MDLENLIAFLKPNQNNYSETFIENMEKGIKFKKKVLFGGYFPTKTENGEFLIKSPIHMGQYWIQKNILKHLNIPIRNFYLSNYFEKNQIRLVFANYGVSGALVYKACEKARVPLIIHFHGFDAYDKRTLALYGSLYKDSFGYASKIISVSLDMSKALENLGAPANKILYHPYGVDLKFFKKGNPDLNPVIFLSVARFAEKKSPSSTIHAFHRVMKEIPEAELWMAGIGPLWEASKELAHSLGLGSKVHFLGVQSPEQIKELHKKARIFVQHSVTAPGGDKEGTPNSILEAAASGLPVISTYHAGIPEAVIHMKTGFLVKEHDIEGMAHFMIKLAREDETVLKMGLNARLHMEDKYDSIKQIETLNSILNQSIEDFKEKE